MGLAGNPEPNRIYLGNCLSVMADWPDGCVDHCIADPPFGIASGKGRNGSKGLAWAFSSHVTMQESWDQFEEHDFDAFNITWLKEVCRLVRPNGNIFVFGTYHNIYQLGFILQRRLNRRILNSIVWYKPNAQPNITARTLTESTEYLIWAVNETPDKAKNWRFNYWEAKELSGGKQMRNLWFSDKDVWAVPVAPPSERKLGNHPSQKPEELTDRLMAIATSPGDLILDPFAGVGGSAISALKFGRRYVLIESEARYVEMAHKRIDAFHDSIYAKLFGEGGSQLSLNDLEKRLLAEVPVPQADDLARVFDVPRHVENGIATRTEIAKELQYESRQGPYYTDAAIALRLIRTERRPDQAADVLMLTEIGEQYQSTPENLRDQLRRDIVLSAPIIKYVSARLGVTINGEAVPYPPAADLTDQAQVAGILQDFGISQNTATRRAHTLCSWLAAL